MAVGGTPALYSSTNVSEAFPLLCLGCGSCLWSPCFLIAVTCSLQEYISLLLIVHLRLTASRATRPGSLNISHVYMRGAICIDMSSWKRSLHAYGKKTCEILVLLRQPRHS